MVLFLNPAGFPRHEFNRIRQRFQDRHR